MTSRKTNPKKHHYVSEFYLKGFTSRQRPNHVQVLDKQTGKAYPCHTRDAAQKNNYNKLNYANDLNENEYEVEELYAQIESNAKKSISHIQNHKAIPPTDESYKNLIWFLALSATRTPATSLPFEKCISEVLTSMTHTVLGDERLFEHVRSEIAKENKNPLTIDRKKNLRHFEESNIKISLNSNECILNRLDMLSHVYGMLFERNWHVATAPLGFSEIICSDQPVTMQWINSVPDRYGLGFGSMNTCVTFPIDKKTVVFGIFEDSAMTSVLNEIQIGFVNYHSAINANRFVYSAEEEFQVSYPDRSISGKQGFLDHINNDEHTG